MLPSSPNFLSRSFTLTRRRERRRDARDALVVLVDVTVLVSFHLGQAENGVLALGAVVVGLLAVVAATVDEAELGRGELLESGGVDGVHLLVLPSMGHDLVGVGAVVVALEAVEVAARFLGIAC
jgi:hypothetical protein